MVRKIAIVFGCAAVMAVLFGISARAETPSDAAQRQEQEKAAEKKLTDINKSMDELAGESTKAEGKTRAELNKLYEDFKQQQAAAKKSLEELRKSTNETWDKAKKDMDRALDNLNGLYERSKTRAKEGDKDTAK